MQEAPYRLPDWILPSSLKPHNFWTRTARVDLIAVLEFSSCGANGLPYVEVELMSLLCSGSMLCCTTMGQTFGQKYGSTLCLRLTLCSMSTLCLRLTLCSRSTLCLRLTLCSRSTLCLRLTLCSRSTLCLCLTLYWVDLMLGWPYVGLTSCWVDLILGWPYVGSTICWVDLLSCQCFVSQPNNCRVTINNEEDVFLWVSVHVYISSSANHRSKSRPCQAAFHWLEHWHRHSQSLFLQRCNNNYMSCLRSQVKRLHKYANS